MDHPFSSPHPLRGRTLLQIVPHLEVGSRARAVLELSESLAEIGARPLVASKGGALVRDLQVRGGVFVPFPAEVKGPIALLGAIRTCFRLIRHEKVELIHARSQACAWVAYGATRFAHIPFITQYEGHFPPRPLYDSVISRGDRIITPSLYAASRIAHKNPATIARTKIIPQGIDFQHYAPSHISYNRIHQLRRAWGVQDEQIIFLLGPSSPFEGYSILLDVAQHLRAHIGQNFKIIFALSTRGVSADLHAFQYKIAEKDLTSMVRCVDLCTDMPAAFLAARVVVLLSECSQSRLTMAVEAQAMGAPLIVEDLGAASEVILAPPQVPAHLRTGWRIPARDPLALVGAIVESIQMGASDLDALAVRARTHAMANFSLARMCQDTLDLYAAIC